jgi:hypothetical protein
MEESFGIFLKKVYRPFGEDTIREGYEQKGEIF